MKITVNETILSGNLGDFENRANDVAKFYKSEYERILRADYPDAQLSINITVQHASGCGRELDVYVDGHEDQDDDYELAHKIQTFLRDESNAIFGRFCDQF